MLVPPQPSTHLRGDTETIWLCWEFSKSSVLVIFFLLVSSSLYLFSLTITCKHQGERRLRLSNFAWKSSQAYVHIHHLWVLLSTEQWNVSQPRPSPPHNEDCLSLFYKTCPSSLSEISSEPPVMFRFWSVFLFMMIYIVSKKIESFLQFFSFFFSSWALTRITSKFLPTVFSRQARFFPIKCLQTLPASTFHPVSRSLPRFSLFVRAAPHFLIPKYILVFRAAVTNLVHANDLISTYYCKTSFPNKVMCMWTRG